MSIRSITLAAALIASFSAQAAVNVYTDRSSFLAALSSSTTDNLNDITDGGRPSGVDRGAYAWDMNSYGCNSGPQQCGGNDDDGLHYPAYVWTYADGAFTFDAPISAFGLDFGHVGFAQALVKLNGVVASLPNGGGFLGIVNTSGTFTTVSYESNGSGALFDNVTYGQAGPVPEPGSLAFMLLGVAALGLARRR